MRTHARSQALRYTRTHARTHTHARTRTHARTHTHARTRTHARTHAHTRTHARTHTHAHTSMFSLQLRQEATHGPDRGSAAADPGVARRQADRARHRRHHDERRAI